MPNEKKIQIVKDLKERLSKAQGVVLTDYQGLSVPEVEALRSSLREVSADLQVVKNTLLNLALRESSKFNPPMADQSSKFVGPTAIILSHEDEIAPLKALYDFAKEHEPLQVKGGFFEGAWLVGEKLKEIASLPSRKVLLAKLLGMLQSPIVRFVNVGKENQNKLIVILKGYSTKMEDGEPKTEDGSR